MENELKPCPFCGKRVAEFSNLQDCEICANFESDDCPECYEPSGSYECPTFIVCSVNKGGCGASTGWYYKMDELIAAWNRRVNDG